MTQASSSRNRSPSSTSCHAFATEQLYPSGPTPSQALGPWRVRQATVAPGRRQTRARRARDAAGRGRSVADVPRPAAAALLLVDGGDPRPNHHLPYRRSCTARSFARLFTIRKNSLRQASASAAMRAAPPHHRMLLLDPVVRVKNRASRRRGQARRERAPDRRERARAGPRLLGRSGGVHQLKTDHPAGGSRATCPASRYSRVRISTAADTARRRQKPAEPESRLLCFRRPSIARTRTRRARGARRNPPPREPALPAGTPRRSGNSGSARRPATRDARSGETART